MVEPWKISGRLGNQMFQLAYLHAQVWDGFIPDIYLQDPWNFEHHRDEIVRLFGGGISGKTDMVAIHVRRGDYVDNRFYVDLNRSFYYERAMEMFPNASFLVFSDDIEWCKKQPIFAKCNFSEGRGPVEDMNLMASCVGHIIANSSFSWWGAYISPYSRKVIAPKEWYSDGIERTICPKTWLKI